ncbi:uncharacterized protein LOC131209517 isoform X2 [Anopheles bellator]|uniref:uncharacterized protein LOC131209517 isoform X2 n=1 Tax=Anopheles bellator TaxID=139047 RepID=UPI0026473C9F|nr:uncharacterized protein LOC131209517 isoform X2 [Anopheles bellator]
MDHEIAHFALLVCFGLLLEPSGASHTILSALTAGYLLPCGDTSCREDTEVCKEDRYCDCRPHFEDLGSLECVPCPGEGQFCRDCCISEALTCYRGICQRCAVDSSGNCIQESLFFLTAAQVALATAMVLGVISLSFLLYKTLRSRLRRNNSTAEREVRQSVVSRVSLSSIQQRVVRRLRDRPPKYETRHNYEHHQRQNSQQNAPSNTSEDATGDRSIPVGGPPPAYEGDTLSLAENPPPYTPESVSGDQIAVIDISSPVAPDPLPNTGASNGPRCSQGIINQVFEPDKVDPPPAAQSIDGTSEARAKDGCYDIRLVNNDDKVVYM